MSTSMLRVAQVACLLALGCGGDDPTSLRLRLVFDPELQSEQQILGALDTVEVVLDASGGFTGVTRAGQRVGELAAADVDGDGMLELVYSRRMEGSGPLPLLRLLPGSNSNRNLQVTARGLSRGQLAAFGGVGTLRFAPGVALDVFVPFNLRPAFLPPRVLLTMPQDGETKTPGTIAQVYLEFSKAISEESARGRLQLVYESTAGDRVVPGEWALGSNEIDDLGLPMIRTTATFKVPCTLSPGAYRVEAATGIQDTTGVPLDQHAGNGVPDGFVGRFAVPGQGSDAWCAKSMSPCQRDEDCNYGAPVAKYSCDVPKGQCVASSASCASLACPKGYVCEAGTPPQCVQDCRLAGNCAASKEYCDASSGVCLPCGAKTEVPGCGGVAETIDCVFQGSALKQTCSSSKGSCSGFGGCSVTISGQIGEAVTWTSSCGAASIMTKLDGTSKKAVFDCTPAAPVKEMVKCVFDKTTSPQTCTADTGASCTGVGACVVTVSGNMGQKVTWKSTCGGLVTTTIDGTAKYATFTCS